jgi:hypothetical protein
MQFYDISYTLWYNTPNSPEKRKLHNGAIYEELLKLTKKKRAKISLRQTVFFLLERPNLFAVCNNTFSKWWEG